MNRFARRPAPLVLLAALGLALAACTADPATVGDDFDADSTVPGQVAGTTDDAGRTAQPSATDTPGAPVGPGVPPNRGLGDVEPKYPELSVEIHDGYVVSVANPGAKAWRVAVAGSGTLADDRLEIIVEVGDIAPGAEVRFELDGQVIDVLELGSMVGAGTAASGGCHPTLDVCVSSADIAIDPDLGQLTVRLEALGGSPISVEGATAGWPEEPFILGPWETTEPFVGG